MEAQKTNFIRQCLRSTLAFVLPRRWFMVSGPASSGCVCLTFDDGPHPENTPRVLDALRAHNVRATFFVIGQRAAEHPRIVKRIIAEGHALGHHSYTHSDPHATSTKTLMNEIALTDQVLREVTGSGCGMFRPPRGQITSAKLLACIGRGLSIVLWNVDPRDYRLASVEPLKQWCAAYKPASGDVVLMHDAQPYAAEVIDDLAASVRRAGLDFAIPLKWRQRGAAPKLEAVEAQA